ncbi:hypothetical protein IUY40_09280 [Flavobacterium sp. ALJ2]|uniref:hypothetical protein n=1 Tax=Flavobacterium sp. ALJ2 TaxID=2786960 RepID=UPI00189FC3F4|nr:hypothetical protein [Flavobacterium sp. ALJ2]MBF7091733.1 hypothetical protein [Flavobacterium sp. ALJ2]
MRDKPFDFFDAILEYLSHENGAINPAELLEHVFPKGYKTPKRRKKYSDMVENMLDDYDRPNQLSTALGYLKSQGLIKYDVYKQPEYNSVSITAEGLLKIKTNGFKKEYNKALWKDRLDKYSIIFTFILLLFAFLLSLYNYFYPSK